MKKVEKNKKDEAVPSRKCPKSGMKTGCTFRDCDLCFKARSSGSVNFKRFGR